MARKTLDIENLLNADVTARTIANQWQEYSTIRVKWTEEKKELRNYVFATDTRTTSNSKLPWSNSTTTPKLTQIYDNLKANYTAAIFPNSNWMRWSAEDQQAATKQKTNIIQAYMENKTRQGGFRTAVDRLIDDFILYGNCFATVEFTSEYNQVEEEYIPGYIGPKVRRISPYDIVFDPTASNFEAPDFFNPEDDLRRELE